MSYTQAIDLILSPCAYQTEDKGKEFKQTLSQLNKTLILVGILLLVQLRHLMLNNLFLVEDILS